MALYGIARQGCFITAHLVRQEALKLKLGKACANDNIVAEMIRALDDEGYPELSGALDIRLQNTPCF